MALKKLFFTADDAEKFNIPEEISTENGAKKSHFPRVEVR